eukprot:30003-Pelagococcus_subviridis.AAC.1
MSFVGSSSSARWKQLFAWSKYSPARSASWNKNPWDVSAFPRHHSASCFFGLIRSAAWNLLTASSIMSTASGPCLKCASSRSAPPHRVSVCAFVGSFAWSPSALIRASSKNIIRSISSFGSSIVVIASSRDDPSDDAIGIELEE